MNENLNNTGYEMTDLDNSITLKSLVELLDKNFFIPSYQRGYRWTEQQVKELLNDIDEFSIQTSLTPNPGQFYCLQPLVVKKMNDAAREKYGLKGLPWYEVVDGQQRLTTFFLILRYLHQKFVDSDGDYPSEIFTIKYERNLNGEISLDPLLDDIDSFHFRNAYSEISEWIKKRREQAMTKGKMSLFYDALVTAKISTDPNGEKIDDANNVRFIWYELSENEDPIKVFTRLNVGKISLTNAELIKALLLKSSNFEGRESELKLRQQEIASEWDNIEYTLQNDEFWLFLHEAGYDRPTRIDFIFDLICEHNALNLTDEQLEEIGTDEYRTFRYFYEYFTHTSCPSVKYCWEKVVNRFSTFSEWYDESEIYHYVGFLISCGVKKLEVLLKEWTECKSKTSFIKILKREIKSVVCKESLDEQYDTEGKNKWKTRRTLLFHNIQTVINQNKVQKENIKYGMATFYKFPFHLYKLEGWDVEHICSNVTNSETDIDTQKEWLMNCYLAVDKELQEEIKAYFESKSEEKLSRFIELKSKINIEAEESELTPEEKNRIWNYTLLDSSSNRSYGNSIFSAKRRVLIGKQQGKKLGVPRLTRDKDRKIDVPADSKSDSAFVPPCTMNVFLKYYSTISSAVNYWTKHDCEEYKKDIQRCINELSEDINI
ncbi:MAG: DUF262 domain-containing protein [Bacteroides sp.]|nr:DUF262 domain-containing protein [Bacteroides sp.]